MSLGTLLARHENQQLEQQPDPTLRPTLLWLGKGAKPFHSSSVHLRRTKPCRYRDEPEERDQ